MEILPRIDQELASLTLNEIDSLIKECKGLVKQSEENFAILARLLYLTKSNAYWTTRGLKSEEDYIKTVFPQSRSQYYALVSIGESLGPDFTEDVMKQLGRSKCEDLARIKKHFGSIDPSWIDFGLQEDKDTFRRRVRAKMDEVCGVKKSRTSDHSDEDHFIKFRLFGDMVIVVNKALDIMSKMSGNDKSSGDNLALICANFNSQFGEDGRGHVAGQNSFILLTVQNLVKQLDFNEKDCAERLIGVIAGAVDENKETK